MIHFEFSANGLWSFVITALYYTPVGIALIVSTCLFDHKEANIGSDQLCVADEWEIKQ